MKRSRGWGLGLAWMLAWGSGLVAHAEVRVVVRAASPTEAVRGPVPLEWVWLNAGAAPATVAVPDTVPGFFVRDGHRWPVVVRFLTPGTQALAAGGFAVATAALELPAGVHGAGVVQVGEPWATQWALLVGEAAATPAVAGGTAPASLVPVVTESDAPRHFIPQSNLSRLERTLPDRFQPHEAIYFLWGADEPAVKFQLSLKYRIMGFDGALESGETPLRALHFGYTQRSLWDITAESSPFYDTSYMPELFFEWLAREADPEAGGSGWFTWLGWQTGVQHESNGRDATDSRSLNIAYVRPGFVIGDFDGWRLIVAPRLYTYVGGLSNNRTLDDYRGFTELRAIFGHKDWGQLAANGRLGQGGHKGSLQLDLTVPLRWRHGDFALYGHVQYFDGYGESLRDFSLHTEQWRFGVALVQ